MLYFANISALTNDKILIFFQKIRREKLYKKLYEQIRIDSF